jgi:hypothetical protein
VLLVLVVVYIVVAIHRQLRRPSKMITAPAFPLTLDTHKIRSSASDAGSRR